MADFLVLKQQHQAMMATSDQLFDLLRGDGPERVAAVGECRVELSRLLHQHLLTEEQVIIAPLRRGGLARSIPHYASIAAEAAELRGSYSTHVHEWSLRAIQTDWAGYAAAVRTLIAAMRALIKREEAELWPAAERLLRPGAPVQVAATPAGMAG